MYTDIKDLLKEEFKYVKIDPSFSREISRYTNDWCYKSVDDTDHSAFLGSNLMGVNRIVYSEGDEERFFKTFIKKSKDDLDYAFKSLPDINPTFNVSSNPMYLSLVSIMHLVYESDKLPYSHKENIIRELFNIYSYKVLSSILNHWFKYPARPDVAKATYERLNDKYLLKKEKSWNGVIRYRANDVLPGGYFYYQLERFTTLDAVEITNGIHTRYKEMLKNIYRVYLEVLDSNQSIGSDTKHEKLTDEDNDKYNDNINAHQNYVTYMRTIIHSPSDFINDDLIYLTATKLNKLDKDKLLEIFKVITSIPYNAKEEMDYLEKILVSSFTYLNTRGVNNDYHRKILLCINYLKGYWSSGNIKDPMAKEAKAMVNELILNILNKGNKNTIPPLTIGFLIYIFLRAVYGLKR